MKFSLCADLSTSANCYTHCLSFPQLSGFKIAITLSRTLSSDEKWPNYIGKVNIEIALKIIATKRVPIWQQSTRDAYSFVQRNLFSTTSYATVHISVSMNCKVLNNNENGQQLP